MKAKKKVASGTQNSTSLASKQNSGTTSSLVTPADQLSHQLPRSRVTTSHLASSLGTGRKDANKSAKNSSNASRQNSAVSAVSSESADKVRHSAESKSGYSNARTDSRKPESTPVTGADGKEASKATVSNPKSNLHDSNHQNSPANVLSSDGTERAKRSVKSRPKISVAETVLTFSSVTVPSDASNTPGNVGTARTGTESLHHRATGSGSLSTRSRKNPANKKVAYSAKNKAKGVSLVGNEMPDRSEGHDIQLLSVEGTVNRSSAMTRNTSAVNRFSSDVAVSQQSVTPSSSEAMASEQASDAGDVITSGSTASMGVMTSGKTIGPNQSKAASTRSRSVIQSRQTNSQTASSSETVASDQTVANSIILTASQDVMTSGKTTQTIWSNAASTRNRSLTRGRPAATNAQTSPSEALANDQTDANSVIVTANKDVMNSGKTTRTNRSNAASTGPRSVTQSRTQTSSSSKSVAGDQTTVNSVIVTSDKNVMTSGKTTRTIWSNAASTRTRSVTESRPAASSAQPLSSEAVTGDQASAAAATASAATADTRHTMR